MHRNLKNVGPPLVGAPSFSAKGGSAYGMTGSDRTASGKQRPYRSEAEKVTTFPGPNLRIGVIGTGEFGSLIARHLAALPGVSLTALGNRTVSKAEQLAKELGVKFVFSTLDELLAREVVDALVIATRTDTHAPFAVKALTAGLDVFVEKPAASNAEEVERILKARDETGQIAMVGHVCLFHSLVNPLVHQVQKRGFKALHFTRHRSVNVAIRLPEEHPIPMVMVHDLYVAAQMARGEEPAELDAIDLAGRHGVQYTWATLRWQDGRVATFHAHNGIPETDRCEGFDWIEAFGDDYYVRVDTNPQPMALTEQKKTHPIPYEISEVEGAPVGMLAEELRSFVSACAGKTAVVQGCRIEDALQVQRWIDKLVASARSRKRRG